MDKFKIQSVYCHVLHEESRFPRRIKLFICTVNAAKKRKQNQQYKNKH